MATLDIVREYFELLSRHDLVAIFELEGIDALDHSVRPGLLPRLECNRQLSEMYLSAFPDLSIEIVDQVSEGDKIVTRWTACGTHQRALTGGVPPRPDLIGLVGHPPTGNTVTVTGIAIDRVLDATITDHWGIHDALGMMQQIGAIPVWRLEPKHVLGNEGRI